MPRSDPRHLWAAIPTAVAASFLLCGYELFRSASNSLFKAAYGADRLPLVTAIMPLGLLAMLYVYARLLSWFGPRKTLVWTNVLSGLIALGCYFLIQTGAKWATGVMWVFKEAYIILIIEQYWSFLNSTFSSDSAKKLNGPIIGISSLGAITGGLLTSFLAERLGSSHLLLIGALFFIPAAFCSDLAYRKCGEPLPAAGEEKGKQGQLGLRLFKTIPLLAFLFLLILLTQVVSAVINFRYEGLLQDAIPDIDRQTAFSGRFFAGLNGVALVLQFLVTPFLLKRIPVTLILGGIAVVNLATAGVLTTSPSLATAATAFFLFKTLDYSVFRAAKETLYIPLSFDARYRAKEVIDGFGYRFSKGGMSILVVMAQSAGVVMTSLYSWIALVASGAWFGVTLLIARTLGHERKPTV